MLLTAKFTTNPKINGIFGLLLGKHTIRDKVGLKERFDTIQTKCTQN